ncbi:MAG: DNA methyltransferase [Anaerolineae bacterium]|nr:DNA methyltransferase [Anaerolineae bacterium]
MNQLYYGDNLTILRQHIPDESVDLIYLDPPFNSNRDYNILFKDESKRESVAQITAFEDTWHWDRVAQATYEQLVTESPITQVSTVIAALRQVLGANQMMAYLVMMAARLVELHRVLKPTGSLYLHCDTNAATYLQMVLNAVFGPQNFRNTIVWKRSDTHNDARKRFANVSDFIFFYTKSDQYTFQPQYVPHSAQTLSDWYQYLELPDGTIRKMTKDERRGAELPPGARRFNTADMASPKTRKNLIYEYKGYPPPEKGWRYSREKMEQLDSEGRLLFPANPKGRIMLKRYLDEQEGAVIGNVWTDIGHLRANNRESLGYPTQKPIALLERIILASSKPGDVVLDPFCGCGTAIAAAQKLGRQWIGIDITHLAISLIKSRLSEMFPELGDIKTIGEPADEAGARALAQADRYQFQWWALSLVKARPVQSTSGKKGKKGADQGIDGVINFFDDNSGKPKRVLVQVKSGKVDVSTVRDLRGTLEREGAQIAILITLEPPTSAMLREAASAGEYQHAFADERYPRLQILTIKQLVEEGARPHMPPPFGTFKRAAREKRHLAEQAALV